MKIILSQIYEKSMGNLQIEFHEIKISIQLHKRTNFQNMEFSLSIFHKIFINLIQNYFHVKIENPSFRCVFVPLSIFGVRKLQNCFCKMSKKV